MASEQAEQATPKATLVIHWLSDGNIAVQGPTADRLLCLGMLDMARFALMSQPATQPSRIMVPTPRFGLNGK